ncbi:glycosyltransferase [Salinibacterium sp. NK8237]|uniref:glycosyltransferase n=1 Tax=Salinibacterium sp. NK8237 TaxID=2792038 RepID=UPI001E4ACDB4|nr:glycosyltransferase [Salinibacterium sp. NK8237]
MGKNGGPSRQSEAFVQLLLDEGLATRSQIQEAREVKARSGAHIDQTLASRGHLDSETLVDVISRVWKLERASMDEVDSDFARQWGGQLYIAENWMPLKQLPDGRAVVATARVPDEDRSDRIRTALGCDVVFVAATSAQIWHTILDVFGPEIADQAANDLWNRNPVLSARTVASRGQKVGLLLLAIVAIICLILWPVETVIALITLTSLVFLAGTAFKFFISLRGARFDLVERVSDREVAELDDGLLPRYTVLVPVFKEANIVAQLVKNLGSIDWPTNRLEVFVLIEESDHETRDAFDASSPPDHFHVITIPAGHPQTKPRACNVGLFFATGDYLVIYDAEDTPEPDQLKKSYISFQRGGEKTVCVQAALNYFNSRENVLTRMFSLEYGYWFDYMLAGLDSLDLPIPLGGTSNHFRTEALKGLGGWDPYNVTEDADLGIRASALGYRVGVVNSATMEEANTSIPNFVRQRSRWIKGYMQTTLVHARRPAALMREIGFWRFSSFVLLIAGTPATFLGVLPFYVLTVLSLALPPEFVGQFFPYWLLWICFLNFIIGSSIMVYLSMMGPYKRGTFALVPWALLNPLYWILHSVASYKALWQLITKPHYWEKTEHGLTNQTNHD